ncbi:MAG: hypothetical protein K1X75_17720 [Leptospirales bacterium]|nr:hypothetical protein [Leptospirales bacterium]
MLCPAKVNLGLEVRHRRASDGYHYINSIFLPISFGDELLIEEAAEDRFVSINELPPPYDADYSAVSSGAGMERNLVWQTLQATATMERPRLEVRLRKRCPTGAGLGGGSADAGALLRLLAAQFGLPIDALRSVAGELGADVPFFLDPRPAEVSGIGDIIKPLVVGPGHGVLIYSGAPSPTAAAYAALKRALRPDPPPESLSALTASVRASLAQSDWSALSELKNDFEAAVFAMRPDLERLKAALFDCGAAYASLSGSGAALFGLATDAAECNTMLTRLQSQLPEAFLRSFQILGATDERTGRR